MTEKKVSVTARVRVTLDVPAGGAWGGECSMDQVHKQAIEEVRVKLERAVHGWNADNLHASIPGARIVSMEPLAVSVERS